MGTTKKCVVYCNELLSTKEECYAHMYLSLSQCCQRLYSNLEKCGYEEEIKKVGIQKVCVQIKASQRFARDLPENVF